MPPPASRSAGPARSPSSRCGSSCGRGWSCRSLAAESQKAEIERATHRIRDHVRDILQGLGEDPDREGLLRTPERVEKSLKFLTQGYTQDLDTLVGNACFSVEYDEM